MKLLRVEKLSGDTHKYKAVFQGDNGRERSTKFGLSGMDDFTLTKNVEQRDRYRARHAKDLNTNDPTRAGYLSYHLLWGDSSSIQKNISSYRAKFNL
jgi:hypothetical protein